MNMSMVIGCSLGLVLGIVIVVGLFKLLNGKIDVE